MNYSETGLDVHTIALGDKERSLREAWSHRVGLACPQIKMESVYCACKMIDDVITRQGDNAWCLAGGCATMLHLMQWNKEAAAARASPDLDVIVRKKPYGMPLAERLVGDGWHGEIETADDGVLDVDWFMASIAQEFRGVFEDAIRRCSTWKHLPIASPEHIIVMKVMLDIRAWRPKDYTDVYLLWKYGAIQTCLVTDLIRRHVDSTRVPEVTARLERIIKS